MIKKEYNRVLFILFTFITSIFCSIPNLYADENAPKAFLKHINSGVIDKLLNKSKFVLAAIEVNGSNWEEVNKIISERGTLVGFSYIRQLKNNKISYICRGIYTLDNSPQTIASINEKISKVTKAKLIQIKEGGIYLAWQRFKRVLHTGNIEEIIQLGIDYAQIPLTSKNGYRDYRFAVEASEDPSGFTKKYYDKHCAFFTKTFPLYGQIMDVLTIKINCENPGESVFTVFEAKFVMRLSGALFNIPAKYEDPWNIKY